jgi:hypothetical protein
VRRSRRLWLDEAKATQPGYVRKVEGLERFIEGNVEKGEPGVGASANLVHGRVEVLTDHRRAVSGSLSDGMGLGLSMRLEDLAGADLWDNIFSMLRTRSFDKPSFIATSAVDGNGDSINV